VTNHRANIYLATLVVGSLLVAAYQALAYSHGAEPTSHVASLWPTTFLVLLVLWMVEDSKSYPAIYKPFEYGFLVLMLWMPYLPYYLWRTRRSQGLLLLAGFVVLYFLGFLALLAVYVAS
jgi:hypothetical protein